MLLVAKDIRKAFGPTRALENVTLEVETGSIHAVIGENGAGKSTLMKILAGALVPDQGSLRLGGAVYAPTDPLAARRQGVSIVYQELSVCPHLSVAENVCLGAEPQRFGFVSKPELERRVRRALAPVTREGSALLLDRKAQDLSTAELQLVEIARALANAETKLLILDEPTSSLSQDDVERLFETLRGLKSQGLAIVYISHFLEEVRQIADTYTVLRDGRSVRTGQVADVTNDELVAEMAGHAVVSKRRSARTVRGPLLTLDELSGEHLPLRASLTLHRGEVMGIAGLMGSGRTELFRAIFGLDPIRRGSVRVGKYFGPASPARRLEQGVGMLSEDRKAEGLALDLSVSENLTLSKLLPLKRHGLLSQKLERAAASTWIEKLGIRCRGAEQRTADLSGGNQQKVALGRLLYHDVDLLLLDEPTRGIDVRSRSDVHTLIDALAEQGKAVLMISSQLSELVSVCDRIAVMHRGVLGPAKPSVERSEHELLSEAAGA